MAQTKADGSVQIQDLSILNGQIANSTIELAKLAEGSDLLKGSLNLSDITNAITARGNLGVDSSAEVDSKIDTAGLALGTNYSTADIAGRDALTGLVVGDNVYVSDDGDAKWAIYKVTAITDGNGYTSTFEKIMDEDVYLNAQSASAIKASYESNADTNAFTDAEVSKLAGIEAGATGDMTGAEIKVAYEAEADTNAFTDAYQTQLDNLGGSLPPIYGENPTITHNDPNITLANTPKVGTVRLYWNGARQNEGAGNDYTISGVNVAFNFNLKNSHVVVADYDR